MLTPTRLTVARKRHGLTLTQLAELTGLSTRSLSLYENGHQAPAPDTLTLLAGTLAITEHFLTGPDIDEIPEAAVSFRALSKMTARQLDQALADGRVALLISDWIQARFRLPDPDIPTLTGHDPESAAEVVRARWGLGERPIGNVLHVLEAHGARIYSLTAANDDLDACSLYWDGKPVIFLSTGKSGERGRFDAAHELGHLVLHGEHLLTSERPTAEAEANRFAAAFLMPRASVLAAGLGNATPDRILRAKQNWNVAAMALTHRLHELDLLTDWGYRNACVQLARLGYRTAEPHGIQRESSQLLGKVFAALRQEGITPARLAADVGITVRELRAHVFGLTLTAVSLPHAAVFQGWAGPGRPVCTLSDARRRLGGLVPGMTSLCRYSLTSCFSSAPFISVMRLRWANCSLARPNQDVVTSTPVVALWSAITPVKACTDSSPTRPVHRLAWIKHTPPKNKCLLVATASTPPSFDGIVVHASAPIATNSCFTRCSNSVGVSLSMFGRESSPATTSRSSLNRNRLRSKAMNGSTASRS